MRDLQRTPGNANRIHQTERRGAVGCNSVLVEIKRPSIELKKNEVDQAELYLRLVRKHKAGGRGKTKIFLVGKTISDEARELAEMRSYPTLLSYSDMVSSCRQRYQEYLKIVEQQES